MCRAILLFDFPTAEFGGHSLCPTHVQNSTCFLPKITSQFSLTYCSSELFWVSKGCLPTKNFIGSERDPLQREIFLWIVSYIGKLDQQKMKCLHFHISINFRENGQWPRGGRVISTYVNRSKDRGPGHKSEGFGQGGTKGANLLPIFGSMKTSAISTNAQSRFA